MSVKSSTVKCLSNVVVKVFRNCCERTLKWDQVVSEWYFQKKNHNSDENRSHPVVLLPLKKFSFSCRKNKNENTEYHGIFISVKSQLYSKQESPIFLLFESWSLLLSLHARVKSKFFRQLQPDNLSRRSTFERKRKINFMCF